MNGLALFHGLGCPIVLGASRKRMIGALSNEAPADQRLAGSLALALKAAEQGAQIDPRPRRPRNRAGAQGVARAARPGADAAGLAAATIIGPSGTPASMRPLAGSHSELTDPSK